MLAEAALAMTMLASERGFLHLPSSDEVRLQLITRADNETGWPFAVESGHLACVWSVGTPVVMFMATEGLDEGVEPEGVILSANPLELTFGNMATRHLFAPAQDIEQRLLAVAPFVDMGRKLCDQPPGEQIRGGEL